MKIENDISTKIRIFISWRTIFFSSCSLNMYRFTECRNIERSYLTRCTLITLRNRNSHSLFSCAIIYWCELNSSTLSHMTIMPQEAKKWTQKNSSHLERNAMLNKSMSYIDLFNIAFRCRCSRYVHRNWVGRNGNYHLYQGVQILQQFRFQHHKSLCVWE